MPDCIPPGPIMPPPRIMPKPMSLRPQSRSRLRPSPWCQRGISLSSSKSSPAPGRGIWAPCGVRSCCCWGCACPCCCIIGPCCAVAAVPPHARMIADVASIRIRFCILTSSDMYLVHSTCRCVPGPDSCTTANCSLLDHLVGERQKIIGNLYTKCFCSLEIDYELELIHLHHRQVGRLLALENAANVEARQPVHLSA